MRYKAKFNPETGVISVLARLSYCTIFEKTASTEGGKLQHRTNILLDKDTKEGQYGTRVIEKAIDHLKAEHWPGKKPRFEDKRFPLRDGDEYVNDDGEVRNGYENQMYVPLTNERKPKIRDRDGQTELDEDDDKIYSGAWAVVKFHIYGVKDKNKGGNGIFATVDGIQFFDHGEKFGGGGIDDDEFEDLGDDFDGDEDDDDDEDERPARKSGKSKPRRSSIDDDDLDDI